MIIKKSRFKSRKTRGQWPFNVPEVAVLASTINDSAGKPINAFCIIHNFAIYAMSGIMENHGIPALDQAGIWLSKPGYPEQKRSLSPFFDHVNFELNLLLEKS